MLEYLLINIQPFFRKYYLLSGNPGTGKTTFIREICIKYKFPIFRINSTLIDENNISRILSLKEMSKYINGPMVLLFEDVDRFFETEMSKTVMSSVLNHLDGIEGSPNNIIRFLTCNDESFLFKEENKAFKSRITRRIKFENPTKEMFLQKFNDLTVFKVFESEKDKEKISQFLNLIYQRKCKFKRIYKICN